MSHEFMSVDYAGADATPGVMQSNGASFSTVGFFPVATGFGVEGSAANDWLPYDRMIQVPHPNSPADEGYGVYLWNRNEILLRENPGPNWVSKHTNTSQEATDGFSHHTGLVDFMGTDGRLYVCGMYPGAGAGEMGWVKIDPQANTYSSGVNGTLYGKPTRMGFATSYEGKLYCASQGVLYIFDPVREVVSTLPTPTSDHRDKLFVMGTKLYLLGNSSGQMTLYVVYGANFFTAAGLGPFGLGAEGEWTFHQDQNVTYVHFWNGGVYTVSIQTTSDDLLSGHTVTLHSVAGPFGGRSGQPGEPNASFNSNDRYFACVETDQAPGSTATGNTIYRQQGGTNFAAPWVPYRWAGTAAPWTQLGASFGGNHSYFGQGQGNGSRILNSGAVANTEKIVIYESFLDGDDRQHLRFWAFSNNAGPITNLSAQIYIKNRSGTNNRTRLPQEVGTMHSVQSGGTFNGAQNRMDDVLQDQSGGGVHELTWDRPTDLIGVNEPDLGVYASLLMYQA